MSSTKVLPTTINQWERPQTSVYENNYGYAVNFYQPMIDYIDEKRSKGKAQYPHLPYTDERALPPYDPSRKIKTYTEAEIRELAKDTDRFVRKGLVTMGTKRSSLKKSASGADFKSGFEDNRDGSLKKSASNANFTREFKYNDGTLKKSMSTTDFKHEQNYSTENNETVVIRRNKRSFNVQNRSSTALENIQERPQKNYLRGKSAKAIEAQLLQETERNLEAEKERQMLKRSRSAHELGKEFRMRVQKKMDDDKEYGGELDEVFAPLQMVKGDLAEFCRKNFMQTADQSKQTSLEIEQLNIRVVEAETRLKTEVQRIKKKLQIHITELELSLDVANKTNIDLQKTIKKQSLQLTEIQAAYDEVQRQLQVTLDQLSVSQRRVQSLTAEIEEIRGNYESLTRAKRQVEQQYEESVARINELTVINVNLASSKSKVEQELSTLAGDYDNVTQELRVSDERYQRVQVEMKSTVEMLHEEQERIVKIEAIKKSLEIEVKNLSVRLEEVEANAIVGSRRIISKLEARMRDLELELDEEKRRHAETIKILRKKERTVKEVMIQCEEDQKNIALLQDSLDKTTQKVNIYKRQLQEQEGMSQQSVTRVRRFQRELEAAEDRADSAESNLTLIRAKHRTFVTTSSVPGSQVYLVQESSRTVTE